MPRHRLERVTSLLRDRIRDAVEMGALKAGARLPGTRRLAEELDADPRLIASAFRRLQQEGLVELRPRSGAYVSARSGNPASPGALARDWAAEVVSQAVERGVPAHRLSSAIGRLADTRKLRAAVIAATSDQAVGMVRELQEDYGITSAAVFPERLARGERPRSLLRAQLLVTTADLAPVARTVATELDKTLIIVRVRPDLFSEDWIAFMNGPVFVVVADPRFRAMLREVLQPIPGSANVRIVLAGSGDVARIPRDARTYVTESARRMLDRSALPGRIIRPRRVFSSETVRQVVAFLIACNSATQAR